jgi:hypothetical protein
VTLLTVSLGTIVMTGAKDFAEHQERYTLELQQRLQSTLQPVGPSGRVDRTQSRSSTVTRSSADWGGAGGACPWIGASSR